jgi:hypothetical protein
LLAVGNLWRFESFHISPARAFAYGRLAYSDIFVLYGRDHLATHHLPYLQTHIEYPVVTGFIMWLTALAPGIDGYFWANATLLVGCAVASLVLLARLEPEDRLWRIALAPMLISYGALNWDMVSVLELVGALYCVRRGRFGWAGALLALGTWTKLYPGLVLPVILAYSLRLEFIEGNRLLSTRSRPTRLLTGFVAVTAALNVPVALLNFDGWSYPVVFQAGRPINPDSIWFHVPNMSLGLANFWFVSILAFGLVWLAIRTWSGDRWEAAALLAILLFLLATRDYSPQYDTWILPLLVILACPLWLWIVFGLADLAYYAGIFWWLYQNGGGRVPLDLAQGNVALGVTIWGREIALMLLFIWGVGLLLRSVAPPFYVKFAGAALLREEMSHADISEG